MNNIKKIQNNGSSSGKNKKDEIVKCVLEQLGNTGKYLKSKGLLYYFSNEKSKLFSVDIKSSDFRYYMTKITNLNMVDSLYKYVMSVIKAHIYHEGIEVDIKNFCYYNVDKGNLYIDCNGGKILKITATSFTTIRNGDDGVVFLSGNSRQEWSFVKDANKEECYLTKLIDSINFDESYIKKKEAVFIMKNYIYSIFFPEILETRPIMVFLGQKGSGKSYFFKVILKVLFGENYSLSGMPSKEENFISILINEYLAFFDNVDNKLADAKTDTLCNASTGGSIRQRKLYSDGEQLDFKLNCFIALNSRTGLFTGRDDLNDRSICLELLERKGFDSSYISMNGYVSNRNIFISQICYELQRILKEISEYENHNVDFRISCWANFVINANKQIMKKKDIVSILKKLKYKQMELTSNSDPFLSLLESILTSKHGEIEQGLYYSGAELHDIFASYAKVNNHIVSYGYKSARSLGKAINNKKENYLRVNNIKIDNHKEGGNKLNYCFTLITNK